MIDLHYLQYKVRGLHPPSVRLRTTHYWRCTRTSVLTRWLGFGQVGPGSNPNLTR